MDDGDEAGNVYGCPRLTDVELTLPQEPFEDYQPNIKIVRKNVLYPLSNTNKSTIFAALSQRTKQKTYTTMAVMTLKATQQDTMKARLSDILMHVSWGDISREYFGKSGSWLYHKLNGIDGNKKPTEFTDEERYQLKGALIDLSERIRRAADAIE